MRMQSWKLAGVLFLAVSSQLVAQRRRDPAITPRIPLGPQGQVLPLQPLPTAAIATVGSALARMRMASCRPAQPGAGPAPTNFALYRNWQSGPEFIWPAVPGAVAYLVERAIDNGSYQWAIAGSTCGSPDAIRAIQYGDGSNHLRFRDITGEIVPGLTYVYKVSAVGRAGELGWNSTRWVAPAPAPRLDPPTLSGSTIVLRFGVACFDFAGPYYGVIQASEVVVTSSYGFSRIYPFSGACNGASQVLPEITGVPIGTHTFTATAQWVQSLDPNLPRVIPTLGTSASRSIEIKP